MKSHGLFQNQPAVEISEGQNKVWISPDRGARILRWERQGREVIAWPGAADWKNLNKVRGGNPVLFPFVARTFHNGELGFWRDQAGRVRPMPQHGFGRDRKYIAIPDETENSLRMRLSDSNETHSMYPFAFQFDVVVTLSPTSRLELRFETTNTGADPLPYYAGHHFYLAIPHGERADWTLELPCATWGRQQPDGSVVHEKAAAPLLRLDDPALIDRFQVGSLASKITLLNTKNDRQLVFELAPPGSIPWYAVTTWTQAADSDFYCVEPWLGLPNAIHHGEGLRWLAPGQKEIATCVLDGCGW